MLEARRIPDHRGALTKNYQFSVLAGLGLRPPDREAYFATSRRGVLRGLHFQLPPHAQAKLVICVSGRIMDAVLDLRVDSPSFRGAALIELRSDVPSMIYVPPGFAHGYLALEDDSTVLCHATPEYSPAHDGGIRWDSVGLDWGLTGEPILSDKDRCLPVLDDFVSPFQMD